MAYMCSNICIYKDNQGFIPDKMIIYDISKETLDHLYNISDDFGFIIEPFDDIVKSIFETMQHINFGDTKYGRRVKKRDTLTIDYYFVSEVALYYYDYTNLPYKTCFEERQYGHIYRLNYRLDVLAKIPKYIKMEILEPTTTFTFYQLYHL
jgi:hypothetical protein